MHSLKVRTRYSEDQKKFDIIHSLVGEQIEHYRNTGDRLYGLKDAAEKAELSANTASNYMKLILKEYFGNQGVLVYDMIFRKIQTSYKDISIKCRNLGIKLLTSPTEWIKMLQQSRGKTPISELGVRIKYLKCGHKTTKTIHNLKRRGCNICRFNKTNLNLPKQISHLEVYNFARTRNLKLDSSLDEFNKAVNYAIENYNKATLANLRWICEKCGEKFETKYSYIRYKDSGCPMCYELSEQLITHKIFQYIFNDYLIDKKTLGYNYQLKKIFPNNSIPKILSHVNVHVDSYVEVKINQKQYKIALEAQGGQHEDSPNGWRTWLKITHGKGTYNDWRNLIIRDKAKVNFFADNNKNGYFLIVIPHTISRKKRLSYIIRNFEEQTEIKISRKFVDWRVLYYNEKITKYL